jgi:protoporphyrinogen oxidase
MVEADLGFFGVAPREIGEIFVTRMEKAFPFFRVGYEAKRQLMLTELAGLQNVVTTGRYGLYLDTDMHDAMVLGEEGLAHLTAGKLAEFYRRHQEIVLERRTVPAGA